jgi:hypothetical protein
VSVRAHASPCPPCACCSLTATAGEIALPTIEAEPTKPTTKDEGLRLEDIPQQ